MAAKFWVGGGTNTNWNSSPVTNWANSSGGTGNQTAPTSTDDVTFDGAGSGNGASVISATITVLSLTFTSGYTNTITISATTTIAGNFTDNTAHTWAGASAITISAASTITSGGKTFPNGVTFSNTNIKILSGNWTISGALTVSGATTLNWTTNEVLTVVGLTMNNTMAGTATVTMSGGTWSGGAALSNNFSIAGNVTISGTNAYQTGTFTYTSGTVTTTSSTLQLNASCTLNTAGITFNNVTSIATSTITINSLLSATSFTVSSSTNPTFAGTTGFTVGTFTCSQVAATTVTFKNGVTYTVTATFNAFMSRVSSILLFTSDDATLTANLILNNGATCNVLANFTRINSSGGRTIFTFNGTLTTTTNITAITDLTFVTGRAMVIQGNSNF